MEQSRRQRLGRQAWDGILERYKQSGQTVEAFCLTESVSTQSFYYWRSRLRKISGTAPVKPIPVREQAPVGFVDLGHLGAPPASRARLELKLDLGDGLLLHLMRG